jgi:hypothetical protein
MIDVHLIPKVADFYQMPNHEIPIPIEKFRKYLYSEKRNNGGLVSWGHKQIYNRVLKDDGITKYNSNLISNSLKYWVSRGLIVKLESGNPQYYIANPYNPDEHLEPTELDLQRQSLERNVKRMNDYYDEMTSNNPKYKIEVYEFEISDAFTRIDEKIINLFWRKENEVMDQPIEELSQHILYAKEQLNLFIGKMYEGKTPEQIKKIMGSLEKPPYTFKFSPR